MDECHESGTFLTIKSRVDGSVAHHLVFLRPKFVGTGVFAELKIAWFCMAERRQEKH